MSAKNKKMAEQTSLKIFLGSRPSKGRCPVLNTSHMVVASDQTSEAVSWGRLRYRTSYASQGMNSGRSTQSTSNNKNAKGGGNKHKGRINPAATSSALHCSVGFSGDEGKGSTDDKTRCSELRLLAYSNPPIFTCPSLPTKQQLEHDDTEEARGATWQTNCRVQFRSSTGKEDQEQCRGTAIDQTPNFEHADL